MNCVAPINEQSSESGYVVSMTTGSNSVDNSGQSGYSGQKGGGGNGSGSQTGGDNGGGNGKGDGNQSDKAGGGGDPSGGKADFSIEAEMLAYKALQSDSEAIACDIASYLSPANNQIGGLPNPENPNKRASDDSDHYRRIGDRKWTTFESAKDACENVARGSAPASGTPGVVIVSSADTTLANFQLWRMNMAIIKELEVSASAGFNCPPKSGEGEGVPVIGAAAEAADQVVTLTRDFLGLFASNESISNVTGTIQDQALMDAVARQLRGLNIRVLSPGTYSSFVLGGIDYRKSPFLSNLLVLLKDRACLQGQQTEDAKSLASLQKSAKEKQQKIDADKKEIEGGKLRGDSLKEKQNELDALTKALADEKTQNNAKSLQAKVSDRESLISSIDAYLATLNGTQPSSQTNAQKDVSTGNKTSTDDGAVSDNSTGNGSTNVKPKTTNNGPNSIVPSNNTPRPIASILAADGLARGIGVDADGDLKISGWHLLWLKALESGGGVLTKSNIFGTKLYFSGGAISTYELFQLDGQLSCSGNLFDYDGYVRDKKFPQEFRKPNIDPRDQLIFYRGRCATPEPVAIEPPTSPTKATADEAPLQVNPYFLRFDPQPVGSASAPKQIKFTNLNTFAEPMAPSVSPEDAFTEISSDCPENTIPASGSCTISVTFAPHVKGFIAGTLRIQPNYGGAIELALEGTGQ
jgi:hypothetical protein